LNKQPNQAPPSKVSHFLTFDLEHWYQGYRYRGGGGWEKFPARDHVIVERLLNLLGEFKHKATFFVTGVFAVEFPSLMKEIAKAGHEIGSHSYDHTLVHDFLDLAYFQEDLRRSIHIIEDTVGEKVRGFRAPKWSIPRSPERFYEALLQEGLVYDSSLFPSLAAHHILVEPHLIKLASGKEIWEFPATTLKIGAAKVPAAGGLWLRLHPSFISGLALRQGETKGQPRLVYLHPYDMDPECPRLRGLGLKGMPFYFARHFSLHNTEAKLISLLSSFTFTSIRDWLMVRQNLPGMC